MATIIEQAQHDLAELPSEMQVEALDFIQFLKTKLQKKSYVVMDSEFQSRERGMAKLLDEIAQRNLFASIDDPAAWQREIRWDRSLDEREE